MDTRKMLLTAVTVGFFLGGICVPLRNANAEHNTGGGNSSDNSTSNSGSGGGGGQDGQQNTSASVPTAGGGGANIPQDPNRDKADASIQMGKQTIEAINKSLDKFSDGVKTLADGFKDALSAASKLPDDNQQNMKDLRSNIEKINQHTPVAPEAVAKLTDEIDKDGDTEAAISKAAAAAYAASSAPPSKHDEVNAPEVGSTLRSSSGGAGGGLAAASLANTPNKNQIPSFSRNGRPGPLGMGGGSYGIGAPNSSPLNTIGSQLQQTYNPPPL